MTRHDDACWQTTTKSKMPICDTQVNRIIIICFTRFQLIELIIYIKICHIIYHEKKNIDNISVFFIFTNFSRFKWNFLFVHRLSFNFSHNFMFVESEKMTTEDSFKDFLLNFNEIIKFWAPSWTLSNEF